MKTMAVTYVQDMCMIIKPVKTKQVNKELRK